MVIPLTNEEYFDNEVCMNCHHVMDFPIHFYLPSNQLIELCENCSFGLYQCARCGIMVSHFQDTIYHEMVYTGPENTFDEFFIHCRECSQVVMTTLNDQEEEYDTETEKDFDDLCDTETSTQIMC
jgi:hypothetical protein